MKRSSPSSSSSSSSSSSGSFQNSSRSRTSLGDDVGRAVNTSFASGTIYHIREVVSAEPISKFDGASVKLLGHLQKLDLMAMRASLVMGDDAIAVDTSLIQQDALLVEGTLYHLIGELSLGTSSADRGA